MDVALLTEGYPGPELVSASRKVLLDLRGFCEASLTEDYLDRFDGALLVGQLPCGSQRGLCERSDLYLVPRLARSELGWSRIFEKFDLGSRYLPDHEWVSLDAARRERTSVARERQHPHTARARLNDL